MTILELNTCFCDSEDPQDLVKIAKITMVVVKNRDLSDLADSVLIAWWGIFGVFWGVWSIF